MFYILQGHEHDYETQTMIQVFRPNDRYLRVNEPPKDGLCILSKITDDICTAVIFENGIEAISKSELLSAYTGNRVLIEHRFVKQTIYDAFQSYSPEPQPWGILTGIRPAKIVHGLLNQGLNEEEVKKELTGDFGVSEKKADLSIAVAKAEKAILNNSEKDSISLYIGVPFCPTRCLYCSFTSFPIKRYAKKMPDYFSAFEKELAILGKKAEGYKIESVYFGGGTPTALDELYLERLLNNVCEAFDISESIEFTVEAGRPDTINKQKLSLLKKYGVSRLSINPQTMNENTLAEIGREHTANDFLRAFYQAREEGFDNINTDLILGLPGETIKEIEYTFKKIMDISPEAVTVHTLSVKRASNLNKNLSDYVLAKRNEMEEMLDIAARYCKNMNMHPYYMYRQKNMIGNFENVGYCKSGYECIYNVQIMEEKQSVFAAGAGAVTKLVRGGDSGKIERVFNVKGIEEYILRIDEMLERKEKMI